LNLGEKQDEPVDARGRRGKGGTAEQVGAPMDTAALITAFTTLFIIIDPPGLAPLYIATTQGLPEAKRRAIGRRACLTAAVLMMIFLVVGERLLNFVGITIPAFRIAGGILLFLTALDMLFERRQARREHNAEDGLDPAHDPSVFPLAIPLIVGPGAITTIILFSGRAESIAEYGAIAGVILANLVIVYLTFLAAPWIEKVLGRTGINVLTRVLGMLLAALAVQFVVDGILTSGLVGG
jgi:multiple antibiotic resistance protein